MAYTFRDRVVQYPGRIKLTPVSGQEDTYDVTRAEGTITTAGTPFNASTFNSFATSIEDQIPDEMFYSDVMSGAGTTDCSISPADLKEAIVDLVNQTIEVRRGYVSIGTIGSKQYADVEVSFDSDMSGVPTVVCSLVSSSTSSNIGSITASAINATASGFTARVFNDSANSRGPGLSYIAIYTAS